MMSFFSLLLALMLLAGCSVNGTPAEQDTGGKHSGI